MPTPIPDRDARRAIANRYGSRWQRLYARVKLATDPLYAAAAQAIDAATPLPLMDVGCGMGLLGQYLQACGLLHGYCGIDHDERKIEAGRKAAEGIGNALLFQHADVANLPDVRGHVAVLDVLHYLSKARQITLLGQLSDHVAPGGILVLRNVLRERNWRFHATVFEEKLLHASGWMRVAPSYYPTIKDVCIPLENAGLEVTISPLWGHTPYNSYLVVARR